MATKATKNVKISAPETLDKYVPEGFQPLDAEEPALKVEGKKGEEIWLVQVPAGVQWSELDGLDLVVREDPKNPALGLVTLPDGSVLELLAESKATNAGFIALQPRAGEKEADIINIQKRVTLIPKRHAPDALLGEALKDDRRVHVSDAGGASPSRRREDDTGPVAGSPPAARGAAAAAAAAAGTPGAGEKTAEKEGKKRKDREEGGEEEKSAKKDKKNKKEKKEMKDKKDKKEKKKDQ